MQRAAVAVRTLTRPSRRGRVRMAQSEPIASGRSSNAPQTPATRSGARGSNQAAKAASTASAVSSSTWSP